MDVDEPTTITYDCVQSEAKPTCAVQLELEVCQDDAVGEVNDCHDENLINVYRSPDHAVPAPGVDESLATETNICHDEIPSLKLG